MATNSGVINIQRVAPSFTSFNSSRNTSLLAKINWVFGAYLTAVVSYCVYNLYKAYQLKCHTSFGLDSRLKLAKCNALFAEVEERKKKSEDIHPLLQKCEALLASITGKKDVFDKNECQIKLAEHYAKDHPDSSFKISIGIKASFALFKIAQGLQKERPDFDREKFELLFTRAFQLRIEEIKNPPPKSKFYVGDVVNLLEFAKAFHSLQMDGSKNEALEKTMDLAKALEGPLLQLQAFYQIAKYCQEMRNQGGVNFSIESIEGILNLSRSLKISDDDLINAQISLADVFYSAGDYGKMKDKLDEALESFQKEDVIAPAKGFYLLAKLLKKIKEDEKVDESRRNLAVGHFIERALIKLPTLSDCLAADRINAYLNIASGCKKLGNQEKMKAARNAAFTEIQALPEGTKEERESKIDLLALVMRFYKETPSEAQPVIKVLEGLYDRCPSDDTVIFCNKHEIGRRIIGFYHETGLVDEGGVFFKQYLSDMENKEKEPFDKLNKLAHLAKYFNYINPRGSPEQIKTLLEAAEKWAPKIPSLHDARVTSLLAEGYLGVDRQKSLRLLEEYQNRKAVSCLVSASVVAIFAGVGHFYPTAGIVLGLGFQAVRLFV